MSELSGDGVERGKRIKEERERLGLTQIKMAEAGGVGKFSQINYEKGDRAPDADYLMGVSAIGADIRYIVTGIRANETPRLSSMKEDIQEVITSLEEIRAKIP